ncbi:hypothetical protein D3C80_1320950 [compost metagenome]
MDEGQPSLALLNQRLTRRDRSRIAIESNYRRTGGKKRGRIPACTKSAIENDPARFRLKRSNHFPKHNRDMAHRPSFGLDLSTIRPIRHTALSLQLEQKNNSPFRRKAHLQFTTISKEPRQPITKANIAPRSGEK